MPTPEMHTEKRNKIIKGLAIAFERLLERKKATNRPLVVMHNNKIVTVSAEEYIRLRKKA